MISTLALASALLISGSTEITVYNQGLGFVKDVRTLHLSRGQQNVVVDDVAQLIDATSVGFKCLSNPGSVSVLEQNYQYDLVSPEAILQKSLGKRIRFTRSMGNQKESVEGILISSPTSVVNTGNGHEYSYNGLVIKTDDGRIILSPAGEIEVLAMPEGLISKPSLLWQVDSSTEQDAKMELSYLTKGMSWTANYVMTLGSGTVADIQGWVSLNNQSGMGFQDATLKLMAGEVNVVKDEVLLEPVRSSWVDNQPRILAGEAMKEESFFEYHLYTIGRPASVRNKETKQLSLLEGLNVPFKKLVTFEASGGPGEGDLESAVKIKFVNNKKSNLGMPMPAGKVRLYQRDASGSLQFLGEDSIKHTPTDEKLSLIVGKSFDIKANHKRTSYTVTGKHSARSGYEVEFRNRKKEAATVYFFQHIGGDWKMVSNSDPFVKEDSGTAVFEVKLKAGEVRTIKFGFDSKR